jgi:hypothetical protein
MSGLQGTFPCIKSCLPSNSVQCCLVLEATILVDNFCADYVGYSQIKTVLTENIFGAKIFTGMIELRSIISIWGIMIAR